MADFELVEHTGILIAAVLGLAGVIRLIYTSIVRPVYEVSVGDKLDALDLKLQAFAEDSAAQIAKLEAQLHTNGGASLRDQTDRIERQLTEHVTDAADRMKLLAIEIGAANRRIDQALAHQSGTNMRRASDHLHGRDGAV